VAAYLIAHGYEVVPVNPGQREILGKPCFKSLKDIPFPVDMANLFLNPARVPPVVDQAVEAGVRSIWMQIGVVHNECAGKARAAGMRVVMNLCIMREHMKLTAVAAL
jgi:predicted CoA-binding protein